MEEWFWLGVCGFELECYGIISNAGEKNGRRWCCALLCLVLGPIGLAIGLFDMLGRG